MENYKTGILQTQGKKPLWAIKQKQINPIPPGYSLICPLPCSIEFSRTIWYKKV